MSLTAGVRLGPYEILNLLGAGGMGEVYRARDTRLDRSVAIKVLSAAGAADPQAQALFEREARAVAALTHPNVLSVYDVGTHEGAPYIVTELLEGETLRARLAYGPLPPAKAIDFAIQIATGLTAAHAKGIVHRDIKPENLFVTTGGHVKILDFGVARLTQGPGDPHGESPTLTVSELGLVRGTAAYMAPEQARGLAVDQRADVFALGCVLYEMLAGARAFTGDSPADIVAAILTRDPPPLAASDPAIPAALRLLVGRCLEKQPNERFSSAHDLALALRAVSDGGSIAVGRVRPAWVRRHPVLLTGTTALLAALVILAIGTVGSRPVLSFAPREWVLVADVENQTGEHVFDKSLGAAFTVSLEQSEHVNVFSRSRVAATLQRMARTDAPAITEQLGREICVREHIRGLIVPAISKVGQSYSLTARMIEPASGDTVRSYLKSAPTADAVLPALGVLAATIRHDLGESLAAIGASDKALPQVTTASLDALGMYAEGAELWSKGKYDEAVHLYESALKADPGFAMAHAALGSAYYSHIYNNSVEGRAHLERALQLSEHTTQREAQVIEIDYETALGHFEKAQGLYEIYLKRYPDDHAMRYNYGGLLRDHGDYSDAVTQYLEVLRIDSGHASALINLATSYSSLGKTAEALEAYRKAFSLEPMWMTSGNLNHEYGFTWVRAGDPARAEEVFRKALTTSTRALATRSLALLDMYRGKYRSALERLQEAVVLNQSNRASLSESRNQFFRAQALQAQGKPQRTLEALDRSAAAWSATTGQPWLGSRIAIACARGGRLDKATQLMGKIRAQTDASDSQQASDLHRLEGEIEIARGVNEKGIELLLLADREKHSSLTQESLARAYRVSGNIDRARPAYDVLLAMPDLSLGWEAQQGWLDAHYWRATTDEGATSKGEALRVIDQLIVLWKDADPDLSVLNDARRLRTRFSQSLPSAVSRQP